MLWWFLTDPSAAARMSRSVFLVGLLAALVVPVRAQSGRWTAHTSMREVTSISVGPQSLWVGTTGGVFSYTPTSGEIRRFTIADGLHGIQVRSIAYSEECGGGTSCVWIGYQDGVIDRLDPQTRAVDSFHDIERAERFSRREINRLVIRGDSLLVATSFGLVVFDIRRNEVRDSYTQFGSILPATPVYDVTVAPGEDGLPHLWVATDNGVAAASVDAPNLKDPAAWQVEALGGGDSLGHVRIPLLGRGEVTVLIQRQAAVVYGQMRHQYQLSTLSYSVHSATKVS